FTSTLSLIGRLHDLASAGAQVIVATHSPLLMALPGAHIVALDADGLRYVEDWRTLDIVEHWRSYLTDPERYLRHVLA
ncbi:MAG TPA: ABC transporter, partial [Micromonosporaceae bacterium]